MREIKFNIYQYEELSPKAQEKAVENMRETIGSMLCNHDADDYSPALEEIEKIFEIKVYDWCVGYPGTYFHWRFTNERWSEMSDEPKFLVRYWNAVERYCRKGWYYSGHWRSVPKSKEHPAGLSCLTRYSKVMWERNCALTGTWTSCVVDDYTGKEIWEYVRKRRTIEDFVGDMLHDFFKQWERDQENNYEDEQIEETILANEYEFREDGTRY